MIVLYIIGGLFGYVITGLLITLLFPVYVNLWEIATLQFTNFYYDWEYTTNFYDLANDDDIMAIVFYVALWPIFVAIAIIFLPFVFFFHLMKFLIYLPSNLAKKADQKTQNEENYRNNVEYQYKKIMEKERKNDIKD